MFLWSSSYKRTQCFYFVLGIHEFFTFPWYTWIWDCISYPITMLITMSSREKDCPRWLEWQLASSSCNNIYPPPTPPTTFLLSFPIGCRPWSLLIPYPIPPLSTPHPFRCHFMIVLFHETWFFSFTRLASLLVYAHRHSLIGESNLLVFVWATLVNTIYQFEQTFYKNKGQRMNLRKPFEIQNQLIN